MHNPTNVKEEIQKAVLVALQLPQVSDEEMESSLAELSRLVHTLGYQVVGQLSQKRKSEREAQVLGEGKLKELAQWTGGPGVVTASFEKKKHKAASRLSQNQIPEQPEDDISTLPPPTQKADVVIFDCDLSPSQLRNMESATGVSVLDRTGVIIEIFSRHAKTRAARLQVEIARLTYVAPRIRETGAASERQGGGIGGKGAGETSVELDRRKIRDRIKELKNELSSIADEYQQRRARRTQEISVALVGYTNAGKSSLMRALTGSEVLVADKLFATLDTTVRLLHPESVPRILISDTVGFIKKLPHDLVASFKSTLDEALNASLLMYVVDAADTTFRSQLEVTKSVLSEVGASEIQSLLILNKIDRVSVETQGALAQEFPGAVQISALRPQDVAELRDQIIGFFETNMVDDFLKIPYLANSEASTKPSTSALGEIRSKMKILSESYDETGVTLQVRAPSALIEKIKTKFGL